MKTLLMFAALLAVACEAKACDGFSGLQPQYGVAVQQFGFAAQPVYQQQFAVAVPQYGFGVQQFAAVPNYGNNFAFVANRGFGGGFRTGFGGNQVIVQNRGFNRNFGRNFGNGFGNGNGRGQVIINNRRGLFGGRQQIIVR